MASGYTFVAALNEVVETVGEFPMAGSTKPSAQTPADTTSIYYRAEQFLDRESKRYQSQGWPENTSLAKQFTASDAANEISVANTILRVRSAGPDKHRSLVIRDDSGTQKLYDADEETFKFFAVDQYGNTSPDSVFLDVTEELEFQDLPPLLQDVITASSKLKFQRRMQGNPQVDAQLLQEYQMAESLLDRNKPELDQPFNIRPVIGQVQNQGGPQRQQPQQ